MRALWQESQEAQLQEALHDLMVLGAVSNHEGADSRNGGQIMLRQLHLFDGVTENWPEVEERIRDLEHEASAAGAIEVLATIILPLASRYKEGERSRELAEEIMAVSL